ncbi:ribosomal-processing cysteine protease Prp [Pseudoflavonifractor sp. MSJ-37]|uniref:ribosomal-processing cysteine protease Prp n=1 Tax=Pseudoflavonifractor sp. MSJ-37 TaxID=2841531 RepID=UPI001C102556|nr:ribosomal-processing cysteine protease Prp [Pseudoflavonifractor sp. MSJ-37]MBU5435306.1 ribosomal-processing cysteine protease Prp [Pseudoflavonifractor sp. MSJ-37]
MTTISFRMEGDRITGFTASGHSGYADEGSDIVCAAVTSAIRLAECAVNDVLGLEASVKVRDDTISLRLPNGLGEANESTCQTLLAALMLYLTELHEEYPDYILVVEED